MLKKKSTKQEINNKFLINRVRVNDNLIMYHNNWEEPSINGEGSSLFLSQKEYWSGEQYHK